ncbi:MAG TPA: hypothetical protein VFC73_06535 [Syntrophomonadaceae bacterium]|nr:hypothetical protein [Syntrophomonadaceae bacterium]
MYHAKNFAVSVMSMDEFKVGLLEAHRTPSLLLKAEENGAIYIGIQLNEDQVLKVDTITVDKVVERTAYWRDKIEGIQEHYKPVVEAELQEVG